MQATHEQLHTRQPRKLHPIMWAAALSVIVLSIVGVGAITGLIPVSNGQSSSHSASAEKAVEPLAAMQAPSGSTSVQSRNEPAPIIEYEAPVARPAPKPAAKPSAHREAASSAKAGHAKPAPVRAEQAPASVPTQVAAADPTPAPARAEPAICHECGTVSSVRTIEQKGEGTGVGAVGGAVAGGVLGRQVGGGRGRDVMTVIGAIAGGLGGHEIEKNVRKVVKHEVSVRFEDGSTRSFTYDKTPMFRSGDHVRLSQGELVIDDR